MTTLLAPFARARGRAASGAALVVALLWLSIPETARADFAEPPPGREVREVREPQRDRYRAEPPQNQVEHADMEPWQPASGASATLRFHVGPALLLERVNPGLFTALDVGQHAVGVRVSAAWLRAESSHGLAAYSAELWVDFRHRYELRPILGAGASWLHGGALGAQANSGAGLLRVGLEYQLPVADADARLSLNLLTLVPAIASDRTRPWEIVTLGVGAGF